MKKINKDKFYYNLISYNISYDERALKVPYKVFSWENRKEYILKELEEQISNNTIICLQEVSCQSFRDLSTFFTEHNFEFEYKQTHFQNNERYILTAFHRSINIIRGRDCENDARFLVLQINNSFILMNCHLPMSPINSSKKLKKLADLSNIFENVVIAGDMNSFGKDGVKRINTFLKQSKMIEATSIILSDDGEENYIHSTFSPFEYDVFEKSDKNFEVPLDRFFIKGLKIDNEIPTCRTDVFFIKHNHRMYPFSDHLMIKMDIIIKD